MDLIFDHLITGIPYERQQSLKKLANGLISYIPDTPDGFEVTLTPHPTHYTLMINKWFQLNCMIYEAKNYLAWCLSPYCQITIVSKDESCFQTLQYFTGNAWQDKERIKILDFGVTQKTNGVLSNHLLTPDPTIIQHIFSTTYTIA
ncbi:hypothetical protein GCM10023231_03010 [Olivibacter ginsenosidimutans]|uniref:Uncharacterized protein n=1 Tax=Olivibacter ginsenosidimutans TaxID=1176537 RepID=A0ABP9ADH4_9SPHI